MGAGTDKMHILPVTLVAAVILYTNREKIAVQKIPQEVEIAKTDFDEAQAMAREIDRQKRKENPEFKGAFHEKKKLK